MSSKQNTNRIKVFLAWLFVGIPLLWGVSQTLLKSMALFQ
jgi:hypothetical protein